MRRVGSVISPSDMYNKGMLTIGTSSAGKANALSCRVNTPANVVNGDLLILCTLTASKIINAPAGWTTIAYNNVWSSGAGKSRIMTKKANNESAYFNMDVNASMVIAMRFVDAFSSSTINQVAGTGSLVIGRNSPGTYYVVFYATNAGTKVVLAQTGGTQLINVSGNSNLGGFFAGASLFIGNGVTVTRSKTSDILHGALVGLV